MTLAHALLSPPPLFPLSLQFTLITLSRRAKLCMTLERKVLSTSEINLNRIGDTLMVTVWIKYLTLSPLKKNGSLQAFFASFAEIYDTPGVLLQQEFICDRHSGVLNTQEGAHGRITQIYGWAHSHCLSLCQQSPGALLLLLLPLLLCLLGISVPLSSHTMPLSPAAFFQWFQQRNRSAASTGL